MTLKNSFRVLANNFSLVWKNMIWLLIIIAVSIAVFLLFATPFYKVLVSGGIFDELHALINNINGLKFEEIIGELGAVLEQTQKLFVANGGASALVVIGSVLGVLVLFLLKSMGDVVNAEILKGSMSSGARFVFCGTFVGKLGKCIKYSLLKTLIGLPLIIVITITMLSTLLLVNLGNSVAFIVPAIMMLIFIVLTSMYITVFSCWTPALVVNDLTASKALKKGGYAIAVRFYRTFSNAIVLLIFAFVINFVFAQYTFCISLFVTIPATCVLFYAFQMVTYYTSQGMKFYVDAQTIITTKRFEQQDGFKNITNVI